MRRISIILSSVITITALASCGDDSRVRVRAVDSPAIEAPLATVVGATVALAPVQLPRVVPVDAAVTAAPVEVPAVAPTIAAAAPAAPAPASEAAPVTPPPVAAAAPVVVEQAASAAPAAPVADQPIDQNANAAAPAAAAPAAAATTTAFTSPPTTVIVKNEMPNVVCMTLQDAQNLIQKAGVFYSKSFDASGKGRKQVWDRGWIVVSQNIAPGTAFGNGDAKLGAVKKDEPNDC